MAAPGFNAVFGPSGVGKTSFARLVAGGGQVDDMAETLELDGINTILYSYNQERLPGWSATGSHLDKICPKGNQELKAELIRIFEVGPVLGSRFSQLSMGQQNRMNLIRYLIQDFDLLIMDESLANVDESLRGQILLSIKERFPDKLFLYISHNLSEVARFCKDILILGRSATWRGGRVVRGLDEVADPEGTHCRPNRDRLDRAMLEIMNAV
jgi:multiple sugar transport system ATP-binding protein